MEEIILRLEEALREIEDFAQGRSNFALEHFVVLQHDLPARQRKQVLDELQVLLYAIYDLKDQQELKGIELEELEEQMQAIEGRERRKLEIRARQLRREIWMLESQMRGREREAKTLLGILERIPRCSPEEFEAQEAEYWRRRLTRQWLEMQVGGAGNMSSLLGVFGEAGKPLPVVSGQENLMQLIGEEGKLLKGG